MGLSSLSDPGLLLETVVSALEVRETPGSSSEAALVDALATGRTLLVLDNCEHLVEACARFVGSMLSACPDLRVLATSREPLGIPGEIVWPVPPLSVPPVGHRSSPEDLAPYGAVRLFVERARARLPGFELTGDNAPAVAEVCRRLEGIPLSLELAAARVGVLSMRQIAEKLGQPLKFLSKGARDAEPRQRTLRATLEWSHDLLNEPERVLFRRLSVFAGGWTIEAAEAVGTGDGIERGDVLDLLSGLVDKSLVVSESEGEAARYRMLEPVRQYAREKLDESGRAGPLRQHATYHLALVEQAEPGLGGQGQSAWLGRLETEHGNLRAALSWALDPHLPDGEERSELGLRLAAALWLFWNIHGLGEGLRWLEAALEREGARSAARAKALNGVGWIALYRGDYERAVARLGEGLALFKELGDGGGAAISLAYLGRVVIHQGDGAREGKLREEAEAMLRHPHLDRRARAELLAFLAMSALGGGDRGRTVTLFEESLALFRELDDARGIVRGVFSLGLVALEQGDHGRAARLLEESFRPLREVPDRMGIAYGLLGLAGVAGARGEPDRAARLWGAAEALRDAIGLPLSLFDRSHYGYEDRLAAARAQLDGAAWEAAWSEGREMTPERAVEYALERTDPMTPAGLSAREAEVLGLVARGLTNAQVAGELFISPRTVNRHLGSVYRKLGISSREAATRFAAEHGLA